jgi:N-acyl-D-amino-acid deacylase
MAYDVVIRNGTVVDGTGLPGYRADVGIRGGIIAAIGRIHDRGAEEIDAEGHAVTPGFIDGHTHMDAQVFWDPLGSCSCWHGVTTAIMGHCGFTLAPASAEAKHLVVRNLERAEDISGTAMAAGIDWTWTTFAEYLDAVDRLPKGINYVANVGHSALRTYVMGERAFTDEATPNDLTAMKREVSDAIRAGAIGFTTSRTRNHQTPDHKPVASRLANWEEIRQLVGVMGDLNAGVFEIAGEDTGLNPERIREYLDRLKALAVDSGAPVTFGMFANRKAPDYWRQYFKLADEVALAGGRMFVQMLAKIAGVVLSFETHLPFDRMPIWRDIRKLPLAEQEAALRNPEMRRKLVAAAHEKPEEQTRAVGAEARIMSYRSMYLMDRTLPPFSSIAQLAQEQSKDPVDVIIDAALAKHLKQFFFQTIANDDLEQVLEMMRHPRAVATFTDSGAHVSQLMDASMHSFMLSYWVRERQALTLEEAIRMMTFVPASHWGLGKRGLLREGWAGDVAVINPDTIMPQLPELAYDLPAGARRLKQKSSGFLATVVNGEVLMRNGEHTGALPGKLLRNRMAAETRK